MKLVLILALLAGCTAVQAADQQTIEKRIGAGVIRVDDRERNVTCYLVNGGNNLAISCIRLNIQQYEPK